MDITRRRRRGRLLLAAATAAALASPAAANAAPSVFTETAKIVPAGQTPDATWTQSDLQDETRYAVTTNGVTEILKESNGVTGGGLLSYDVLPLAYRTLFATSRWVTEAATGAQPHATCDVAALDDPAVILGWQGAEPAYGYIPFQATSAGLGDDPATWLGKVRTASGLALTATTDLAAACAGLGGTFHPADTVLTGPGPLAAALTAPLQAKVDDLTKAKAASDAQVKQLKDDAAAAKKASDAEIKRLKLEATTFAIKVPSSATLQRGLEVNVTGPPNRPVFIRAQLTEAQRKAFGLKWRTLGIGQGQTDAAGRALVIVQPRADTASFLLEQVEAVPVAISAVSGDRAATLVVALGG